MKTTTKSMIALFAAPLAFALPQAPLAAQTDAPETRSAAAEAAKPKVSLKSDVMAIVTQTDADGNQTISLEKPTSFTPGTKLSFGAKYTNESAEEATNFTATNPLHEAVRLAPDADPALIVSVDGGKTFGTLDTLTVSAGPQGQRPATHADVTHVRWTIARIAPGETGRVGFPVIIR